MIHYIPGYIYDDENMLLFNENIDIKSVEKVIHSFDLIYHKSYDKEKKLLINGINNQRSVEDKLIRAIGIVPTYNCNLRCNYCSQKSESGKRDLSINDIEIFVLSALENRMIYSLMNQSDRTLTCNLTGGGEPTYNWELFYSTVELIKKLCSKYDFKLKLGLTTNGVLSDNQLEYICDNFNNVMVSYDGLPEINTKNRIDFKLINSGEITEQSIRRISNSDIRLNVRTTIWQNDYSKLCYMFDNLCGISTKIRDWSINPVLPVGRARGVERDFSEKSDFVKSFLNLQQYAKSKVHNFPISSPILSQGLTGFMCGGVGCNVSELWLFPDKNILTCVDSADIPTIVGKINNGEIVYFNKFDDPLLKIGIKKYRECRNCVAFRVCGSGCPLKHARSQIEASDYISWECEMEKRYWLYILSQLKQNSRYGDWILENKEIQGIPFGQMVYTK